jgi:hypothetical protein
MSTRSLRNSAVYKLKVNKPYFFIHLHERCPLVPKQTYKGEKGCVDVLGSQTTLTTSSLQRLMVPITAD